MVPFLQLLEAAWRLVPGDLALQGLMYPEPVLGAVSGLGSPEPLPVNRVPYQCVGIKMRECVTNHVYLPIVPVLFIVIIHLSQNIEKSILRLPVGVSPKSLLMARHMRVTALDASSSSA